MESPAQPGAVGAQPVEPRVARVAAQVGRPWFWALWVGVLFVGPFVSWRSATVPALPPVLAAMPDFQLVSERGVAFGAAQLRGRAWVANFIFTRCPTVCPMFTAKMAEVQHRARNLGPALHMVSISVDPEYDTPERLADYARRYRANPARWSFLTGDLGEVKRTVIDGLKVSMGREGPEGNFEGIFHGSHFVLVDPYMRIRGYYDANDADAVNRLLYDAGLILNLGGPQA